MRQKNTPLWLTAVLFPAVLFYYETVFRLSTVRGFFTLGTLYMLLFCCALGGIGFLLSTLLKSRKANGVITFCLVFLSAVPYLVQYFVFRQFNIYYDLNTVFSGAADALTSYTADAAALIFSWDGLIKILLFFLPSILLLVFRKWVLMPPKAFAIERIVVAVGMLLLLGIARLGISFSEPLNLLWTSQYDYQSAVGSFGLMTGMGLDVREMLFGSGNEFENVDIPAVTTEETTQATEQTTEATEPPVVYVPNQLDIDFASLQASGTIEKLNEYVASLTPSMTNDYTGLFEGKNLIFITAEAFCAEVIDPELTPTLYRLANKGIRFTDFYQLSGAGTTGGEYQNVFGMLPTDGGKSFKNTAEHLNYFTIGSQLDRLGYWGKAYHNNSYKYYSRHLTHNNLGYSKGFMGMGNGMEEYVQSLWPQSDLEMFVGTVPEYIDHQPFNVYYMSVSGHSGYSKSGNAMTKKNWDRVAHLPYSDTVKGYLAAQLELEDALTYLLEQLEAAGIMDDTVICIAADHFPYGLDDDAALGELPYLSELYGYQVNTVWERDHSALILWSGCLEEMEPIVVDEPTSSLDILPTLSNLFGTEYDSRLMPGRDVFSDTEALVFTSSYNWKTSYGTYYASSGTFVPVSEDITLPDNYVKTISTIVRNKLRYCERVLDTDYFAYLFGE